MHKEIIIRLSGDLDCEASAATLYDVIEPTLTALADVDGVTLTGNTHLRVDIAPFDENDDHIDTDHEAAADYLSMPSRPETHD